MNGTDFLEYGYHDCFDDYDIKSEFEEKMNAKGFDFITNFRSEKEPIYKEAARIHGLKYSIEDETYDCRARLNGAGKAFYVDSEIFDLSAFWRTFERLGKEGVNV